MNALADCARRWLGVPYSWPPPDGDDSDCADFAQAVRDALNGGPDGTAN